MSRCLIVRVHSTFIVVIPFYVAVYLELFHLVSFFSFSCCFSSTYSSTTGCCFCGCCCWWWWWLLLVSFSLFFRSSIFFHFGHIAFSQRYYYNTNFSFVFFLSVRFNLIFFCVKITLHRWRYNCGYVPPYV